MSADTCAADEGCALHQTTSVWYIPKGNCWWPLAEVVPRLAPTHPALFKVFYPLPHQLVSFIFMVQERLLERPADVGVCRCALEIRGSKLGEFVL